jgi:glyoxylase-like metal-dependent hydrolase (beta-lactamase superfamily II)
MLDVGWSPRRADQKETEFVDRAGGVVIRRIAVGPLQTNCYAVHAADSKRAVLVDPGGDASRILDACRDLAVAVIVLTHTHWDHVEALPEVRDALGAPVAAHPADAPVWPHELDHLHRHGHWDAGTATAQLLECGDQLQPDPTASMWDGMFNHPLRHGSSLRVDGLTITVLHTPGHTPGGICLCLPGHVLTGDTLFPGGPGLTGWPLSDFPTIIDSIQRRLLTLPPETIVHPGHGPSTTIGREAPHLPLWVDRGW